MAWTSNGANAEMNAGINHAVNEGHENTQSITLGGALQAVGDKWDAESQAAATTPHSVLSTYAFSRSANGSDSAHYVPGFGFTGSGNGTSAADYEKNLMLRYAGNGTNDNLP